MNSKKKLLLIGFSILVLIIIYLLRGREVSVLPKLGYSYKIDHENTLFPKRHEKQTVQVFLKLPNDAIQVIDEFEQEFNERPNTNDSPPTFQDTTKLSNYNRYESKLIVPKKAFFDERRFETYASISASIRDLKRYSSLEQNEYFIIEEDDEIVIAKRTSRYLYEGHSDVGHVEELIRQPYPKEKQIFNWKKMKWQSVDSYEYEKNQRPLIN